MDFIDEIGDFWYVFGAITRYFVEEMARGVSDSRREVGAFIGARGLRWEDWRAKVGGNCENLGGRLSFL